MMRMPTKLGYKYLQDGSRETVSLGGLGFETERILTGVGSVQAHFTALWDIESVYLYKLNSDSVQEKGQQSLQELELLDEEEWVNKVSGAADRNTGDFTDFLARTAVKNKSKRKYGGSFEANSQFKHRFSWTTPHSQIEQEEDDDELDEDEYDEFTDYRVLDSLGLIEHVSVWSKGNKT